MPLFRNFTYWIDKRKWKYVFLLKMLELSGSGFPVSGFGFRVSSFGLLPRFVMAD
jgi:hypothetical protein